MSEKPAVRLSKVEKYYGTFHALKNVNLTVSKGEKIVVCGPSGSGKSTMIRTINQLEEHQSGLIEINGHAISAEDPNIDKLRQGVGMVFQHFNLFPHMTILENCTLAPEMIGEVLDVMVRLAEEGMTIICVTHEMGFARKAADRIISMDAGEIIEEDDLEGFFTSPKSDRTKNFLEQVLVH